MPSLKLILVILLGLGVVGCESAPDKLLVAAQQENTSIVQIRNVHREVGGGVCGEAIEESGEVDRFYGYSDEQETELTFESKIDLATQKGVEMGPEFAPIGPRLKAGFLRDYERCMASASASET